MPSGIYERKPSPIEPRFWRFVKKTNSCWLWTGAGSGKKGNRYGSLHNEGRMEKAHRVSWEMHYGEIPDGIFVLHKCDNPICVNPDHLFLGTQTDNMRDMIAKGRNKPNPLCFLDKEKVMKIRTLYKTGKYIQHDLGKVFGVSQVQIGNIVNYKSWCNV